MGSANSGAWVVRGGREFEERDRFALVRGVALINWDWLPDLTNRSVDDVRRLLEAHEAYADSKSGVATRNAREVYEFASEIQVGNLIVLPLRPPAERFAAGMVTGPYCYRTDWLSDVRHVVDVDWRAKDLRRSLLSENARRELQRRQTVTRLSPSAADEVRALLRGS